MALLSPATRRQPSLLARLGPGAGKIAQYLSTRSDVLPSWVCGRLSRFQEDVPPEPVERLRSGWRALREEPSLAGARCRAVAGGTVASVYRVEAPCADLAVKLLRSRVPRQLARDGARLRRCARALADVGTRTGLPVAEVLAGVADAFEAQGDLTAERAQLDRMRRSLAAAGLDVVVPQVRQAWSDHRVLVTDYVDLCPRAGDVGWSVEAGTRAARTAMRAVFHLVFVEGLVHCDLHPGNLRRGRDGRVVVLDAGFVRELDAAGRRRLAEFFLALATGSSAQATASLLGGTGPVSPQVRGRVEAVIARHSGLGSREFSMTAFTRDLLGCLRRGRIRVPDALFFPLLSLMSLEGTLTLWAGDDFDFQLEVAPYVMTALL